MNCVARMVIYGRAKTENQLSRIMHEVEIKGKKIEFYDPDDIPLKKIDRKPVTSKAGDSMKVFEYFVRYEAEVSSSLRFVREKELTPEELAREVERKLIGRGIKKKSIRFAGDPEVTVKSSPAGKKKEKHKIILKRNRKGKK